MWLIDKHSSQHRVYIFQNNTALLVRMIVLEALAEGLLPEDEEQDDDAMNARDESEQVEPPCSSDDEEEEPAELRVSDVYREIQERLGYQDSAAGDAQSTVWAAMNDLVFQFNKTMLQSMQQHRKWRFIKKKFVCTSCVEPRH